MADQESADEFEINDIELDLSDPPESEERNQASRARTSITLLLLYADRLARGGDEKECRAKMSELAKEVIDTMRFFI